MEFEHQEEKLHYVLKKLGLSTQDIARKLEITPALISQIQNHYNDKLKKIHLYAIAHAYNIPIEIFENSSIKTTQQIDTILYHHTKLNSLFENNNLKLMEKLVGKWYLYSYPSKPQGTDVWATETTIYESYMVEDAHKNEGKLYIGKNQSIILKESNNSQNITSITFDNNRVTYGLFPFSRVSKSNNFNKELFNFGFFSREKLDDEKAKYILGDLNKVQLQMDYGMIERISSSMNVEG